MYIKIHRLRTRYWYPRRPDKAVRKLVRIISRRACRIDKPVLVFISEKALLTLLGQIYPEDLVRHYALSRLFTVLTYKILWCTLLRNFLPERMRALCSVPLDDIARHKHYAATQCLQDLLSLLKPFSECGVDVSLLPYMYALRTRVDYRAVVDEVYERTRTKCRVLGIAVVDSDFSLIPRYTRRIILTSRKVYVRGCVNLGFLTYLLGRARATRRFFIKTPTVVYYRGIKLSTPLLFLLTRKIHVYMKGMYGVNILENALALEVQNYLSITWSRLRETVHYPLVLVELQTTSALKPLSSTK